MSAGGCGCRSVRANWSAWSPRSAPADGDAPGAQAGPGPPRPGAAVPRRAAGVAALAGALHPCPARRGAGDGAAGAAAPRRTAGRHPRLGLAADRSRPDRARAPARRQAAPAGRPPAGRRLRRGRARPATSTTGAAPRARWPSAAWPNASRCRPRRARRRRSRARPSTPNSRPRSTRSSAARRLRAAAARRRHRQRQDRGLPARHRRLPGARPPGAGAGAGDRPDPADAGALPRAPRRAGACAALGPGRRRTRAHLGRLRARRGAGGRRHALGGVPAAARGRPDRDRRGTRRQLQAARRHPLPRPRLRPGARQGAGRAGAAGQRDAVAGIAAQRPGRPLRAPAPARARRRTRSRRACACSTCASARSRPACRRNCWTRSRARCDAGGQVLVFKNRRGYAPVLLCHDCGWSAQCQRCDAPDDRARRRPPPAVPPLRRAPAGAAMPVPTAAAWRCSRRAPAPSASRKLLAERFPDVPVLRIDRGTTQRRDALEQHLATLRRRSAASWSARRCWPRATTCRNLTLVAVVGIDEGLFSADFRAPEKLAQLLIQVAGRAGRAAARRRSAAADAPSRSIRC